MANTATFTRDNVILAALRKIGVVAQGSSGDPEQIDEAAEALESFVKHLQATTEFRWNIALRTQAITAGTSTYTLTASTDVVDIYNLVLRDADNRDFSVQLIDQNLFDHEYADKATEQGVPTIAVAQFDRSALGVASVTLQLFPTPSTAYTLRYKVMAKQQNMGVGTATQNLDELWIDVIIYGLASRLSDEYGLSVERCTYLENKYQKILDEAKMKSTNTRDTLCIYPI